MDPLTILPALIPALTDGVRGTITIAHTNVDDQVLLKTDGFPTFHLATVIDDHDRQCWIILRENIPQAHSQPFGFVSRGDHDADARRAIVVWRVSMIPRSDF